MAICRMRIKKSAEEPLLPLGDSFGVPLETRLQWDLILSLDGSVKNSADNKSLSSPPSLHTKVYPARYRIPNEILERLSSSQEKTRRAEQFALGGLLYHVISGTEVLSELDTGENVEHIQSCFIKGEFPENVWELPCAVRILGYWCPGFVQELLAARGNDEALRSRITGYIKKHPILFGFKVAGSIVSLASIFALPILGAVGFGVAGPVAGSAAAAWQSSIGLVEAGSIFAWCQSAAMGGAAVGGIMATGLAGAGVAVGATVAGAFDDANVPAPDLKKAFLIAWRRDTGETQETTV